MIYLFGIKDQVSMILDAKYLTEAEQAEATLVVEALPEPEDREGFYAVRYIDPDTKAFSYLYKPIKEEEVHE